MPKRNAFALGASLLLLSAACDPRKAVRTIVRSTGGEALTEQCAMGALDEKTPWRLVQDPSGNLYVAARIDGRRAFLVTRTSSGSSGFALDAVIESNGSTQLEVLREIEQKEREAATFIATRCASQAVVSCWNFKISREVPTCYP